ncbi:hypothetical protein KEM56_001314 [Ascosphaera pollenicola]|nr:hypothetical protein KEM56_001314 [Ascosphaera pollenicola]
MEALETDCALAAQHQAEEIQALRAALDARDEALRAASSSAQAAPATPPQLVPARRSHEFSPTVNERHSSQIRLEESAPSSNAAAPVFDKASAATHVTVPSTGPVPSGGFLPTSLVGVPHVADGVDVASLLKLRPSHHVSRVEDPSEKLDDSDRHAELDESERLEYFVGAMHPPLARAVAFSPCSTCVEMRDVAKRVEYFYGIIDTANPWTRNQNDRNDRKEPPGARSSNTTPSSIKGAELTDADRAANAKFGPVIDKPDDWSGPWYRAEPVTAKLPRLQPQDRSKMQRQG